MAGNNRMNKKHNKMVKMPKAKISSFFITCLTFPNNLVLWEVYINQKERNTVKTLLSEKKVKHLLSLINFQTLAYFLMCFKEKMSE